MPDVQAGKIHIFIHFHSLSRMFPDRRLDRQILKK